MNLFRLHRQIRRTSALERQMDRLVAEHASEWVEIMKRPSALDKLVFARWLKRHERHAGEYLAMEGLDCALKEIDTERRHDVGQLLAAGPAEIVAFEDRTSLPSSIPRAHGLGWAVAAVIAVLAIGLWWGSPLSQQGWPHGWQEVKTAVGEQRVIELQDGSTVHLNTHSRARVRLSTRSRDIQLIAGEALFTVERDPARPFLVQAGGTTIRAVGTQFNVYRRAEHVRVAVLEGTVAVSAAPKARAADAKPPTLLSAGEEASVGPHTAPAKQRVADVARTVAWQQRRLVFRLDTLSHIAEEFNRYNRQPRIRVQGDAARTRRLSGVFDADNPEAFAQMLERDESLTVTYTESELIIQGR